MIMGWTGRDYYSKDHYYSICFSRPNIAIGGLKVEWVEIETFWFSAKARRRALHFRVGWTFPTKSIISNMPLSFNQNHLGQTYGTFVGGGSGGQLACVR
jgi:hypothetical protein